MPDISYVHLYSTLNPFELKMLKGTLQIHSNTFMNRHIKK